jgi:hypothetical protein
MNSSLVDIKQIRSDSEIADFQGELFCQTILRRNVQSIPGISFQSDVIFASLLGWSLPISAFTNWIMLTFREVHGPSRMCSQETWDLINHIVERVTHSWIDFYCDFVMVFQARIWKTFILRLRNVC